MFGVPCWGVPCPDRVGAVRLLRLARSTFNSDSNRAALSPRIEKCAIIQFINKLIQLLLFINQINDPFLG